MRRVNQLARVRTQNRCPLLPLARVTTNSSEYVDAALHHHGISVDPCRNRPGCCPADPVWWRGAVLLPAAGDGGAAALSAATICPGAICAATICAAAICAAAICRAGAAQYGRRFHRIHLQRRADALQPSSDSVAA